ncbi:hypothetical protein IWZ00DRAFT_509542 [Phyllosticta capitalensis]
MSSSRPSRRTRQSRLNFTPAASSSPAAAQLSPDVRHRAAFVDHDGSPRKKQRTGGDLAPAGTDLPAPLTPKSSFPSNPNNRNSGSRGSAFGSASKASSGSPLKSVQDLEEGENISNSSEDEPLPTSQRRSGTFWNSSTQKSQSTIGRTRRKNKPAPAQAESDSESEDMPTSAARRRGAHTSTRQTRARAQENSNGSPQMGRRLTRGSRISSGSKQKPTVISSDEEDSDTPRAEAVESDLGEAESSGDEVMASSPGVKPKKAKGRGVVEVYSSDEEESEEEGPRRRTRRNPRQSTASESEEDDMPTSTKRRRQRRRADSDSEDDEVTSGRMRSHQEKEDLEEDLEFLGTPAKSSRTTPRQKTARELALERLKRSRAGEKVDSVQDEEQEQPRRRRALYDTDSESETVDALDEEEGEEDEEIDDDDMGQDEVRPAIHQASSVAMFQENDDDLDFIEDNEDDTLGVPDEEAQIPLEFSSISRRKAKDLFKFAVEWMVQKKLNPGFAMTDEIYKLTFRKLDDEVRALSDSKFTSSAWTKDFTRALHARPFIEVMEITGPGRSLLGEHCAACNRTNHPATWDIRFTGKPYHRETLEEIDDDDDDEDSDDDDADDSKSYNSQGLTIPASDRVFSTGVHCKTNAQTAHALAHWRYHLNEWVVDYLRMEDHLTPEKIVERDTWSTKQRQRYANEVVDDMAARGEIKRLHHDFRTEIDHARNAKQAGWDRYNR